MLPVKPTRMAWTTRVLDLLVCMTPKNKEKLLFLKTPYYFCKYFEYSKHMKQSRTNTLQASHITLLCLISGFNDLNYELIFSVNGICKKVKVEIQDMFWETNGRWKIITFFVIDFIEIACEFIPINCCKKYIHDN